MGACEQRVKESRLPPEWGSVDYWDLAPGTSVAIFPAPAEGTSSALSPIGVQRRWETITDLLQGKVINGVKLDFRGITVTVEPGPDTSTHISNRHIVVSEGHLRAFTLLAHAIARSETGALPARCYNTWFDYFIDAMGQGDPIVMVDGTYRELMKVVASDGDSQNSFSAASIFRRTVRGATAFLLAHEAAHALLGHERKTLRGSIQQQAERNREQETEADKLAAQMLLEVNALPVEAISAWDSWQLARDVANAANQGGIAPDHPMPEVRSQIILDVLKAKGRISPQDADMLQSIISGLSQKFKRTLLTGQLEPVVRLSGPRPRDMEPKTERADMRMTQLALWCDKSSEFR
jgi:hypothetical protein